MIVTLGLTREAADGLVHLLKIGDASLEAILAFVTYLSARAAIDNSKHPRVDTSAQSEYDYVDDQTSRRLPTKRNIPKKHVADSLSNVDRERIVRFAHGQINDFLDYVNEINPTDPPISASSLLGAETWSNENSFSNLEIVTRFLRYACMLWGVEQVVIIRAPLTGFHPKATTWLSRVPSATGDGDLVLIQVDLNRIRQLSNGSLAQIEHVHRIVRAQCLHEIGHIFCHWEQILGTNSGHAQSPTKTHELEAWFFAFAILAIACEDVTERFYDDHDRPALWELARQFIV